MIHEVSSAVDRVKAAGKPVVAWGGSYSQRQYAIAAHASQQHAYSMCSEHCVNGTKEK